MAVRDPGELGVKVVEVGRFIYQRYRAGAVCCEAFGIVQD